MVGHGQLVPAKSTLDPMLLGPWNPVHCVVSQYSEFAIQDAFHGYGRVG